MGMVVGFRDLSSFLLVIHLFIFHVYRTLEAEGCSFGMDVGVTGLRISMVPKLLMSFVDLWTSFK